MVDLSYPFEELDSLSFEKFKNRSPLIVKISIFDLDTGEQIRDHIRDIRKRKDREWLTKATMWAITNNKQIEIRRK